MPDQFYRVVLDGTSLNAGTVAGPPMTHSEAEEFHDQVLKVFADNITAGDLLVSLLTEAQWQQRQAPAGRAGARGC